MKNVKYLKCVSCSKIYIPEKNRYTCDICGPVLGILDVVYDYEYIKNKVSKKLFSENKEYSIWRYEDFLPIEKNNLRSKLRVGWSPLYKTDSLAKKIGLNNLYIKDDGINPTGSLKDRASCIAVTKALEEKAKIICCSSTGNAASSCAGNAASVGIKTVIFVPERAPLGKVAQLKIFGSNVIIVKGSYEEAFKLSDKAIKKFKWYNRNAAINPYLLEGKKTVTIEICEQMNWNVPDWVIFSVGDGCTIAGAYKGFFDLYNIGFINKIPRLAGIQAEGCAPLAHSWKRNMLDWKPELENTIADSIAVGVPRNAIKALKSIKDSNGVWETVSDKQILDAMCFMGKNSGIFSEPAGCAGMAGLIKLISNGVINKKETVVYVSTGNGLKDTKSAIKAAGETIKIKPDKNCLNEIIEYINI